MSDTKPERVACFRQGLLRSIMIAGAMMTIPAWQGCVPVEGSRQGGARVRGGFVEEGLASWYGMEGGKVREHGKLTASGRRYDQNAMTAAHKTLPLGTRVKVTNLDNNRTIVVVINDRGPYIEGRIIDLTLRGARSLGFKEAGIARVRIQALP